jgi:AcrR family transcriptional regulator
MVRQTTAKKGGDLRHTAEERRAEVLQAAVAEFALHGLHGTSTEMIARRIGISQPYIFRLFPSKKELFLAAVDQCFDRVETAFRNAAGESPITPEPSGHAAASPAEARLHAMGHAYLRLMTKRELLLFQMQAYAACSDDDVRRKVKLRWDQLVKVTGEISGASPDALTAFFARGMLMNVFASVGMVPEKATAKWGHEMLGVFGAG